MTAPLRLSAVTISRVTVGTRTHVEMLVADLPADWLAAMGWDIVRLRAKHSEWWDVNVDGLRVRFGLAYADRWVGDCWRLRFSSRTPNHAAVSLAHRVGQVAETVEIKRCAPTGKQRELDLRTKARGQARVTVEIASADTSA